MEPLDLRRLNLDHDVALIDASGGVIFSDSKGKVGPVTWTVGDQGKFKTASLGMNLPDAGFGFPLEEGVKKKFGQISMKLSQHPNFIPGGSSVIRHQCLGHQSFLIGKLSAIQWLQWLIANPLLAAHRLSFAPRLPAPPSWTIAEEHNGGDWSSTASAWSKEALFNRPDLHAIIKQLDSIEFNETTSQTVTIAARGQPFSVVFDLRTGCRGSMEAPPNCEMVIQSKGRFADGERVVFIPYQLAQNYVARDMLTGAPFQSWKSLELGQAHARLERELEASSQDSQYSQMIVNLHEMTGSCKIRRIVAFASCDLP
ncbi:hypothetical protein R3P38DRAFT_3185062 [Favolaschia claudopus]|uniref:Uncharacterized protein n=1 Tax=Favolaschia claudopus TaxID=2862362 RepID=A0AAW0C6F4_9AGAR